MIPEAEKRSVGNEIGKEELLIKDTEMSLLLLCLERWLSPAGGALRNCASELFSWGMKRLCVYAETTSTIPLVEGCPLMMITPLYSMLPLPTEWSSKFSAIYTCNELLALCNELFVTVALKSSVHNAYKISDRGPGR